MSAPSTPSAPPAGSDADPRYRCRLCGRDHRSVTLAPGERALCTRCGATLAAGAHPGPSTPLALIVTGLICATAAVLLPVMSAEKFGSENATPLLGGVAALWADDYSVTALWVAFCGALAPFLLLAFLALHHLPERCRLASLRPRLAAAVPVLARWSMPEVHVLAFIVAFAKLGDLVNLTVDPGLWFYAAMAFMAILAWRHFDLVPSPDWPGFLEE